jgi:site-specific recombinase XerD
LEGKFNDREIVFTQMQPDDIRRFLARRLGENQSASNVSQHAEALKSYLRYRDTCSD